MASYMLNCFLLLTFISKCLTQINLLNAISEITTRPIEEYVDRGTSFIEMAEKDGYKAEQHNVTTEDGYILTLHRIPPKVHCKKKAPVLIMHGLFQASEGFIDSGAFAPGYVLAEDCYDVWCANTRGNYHARKHVSLNPDRDVKFWQFSVDHIGMYDFPVTIDYVLKATNTKKLIMIGVSQGGGSYFVMNSQRPEYAEKISLFVGLAPATRLLHTKSLAVRTITRVLNRFRIPLELAGIWEVFGKGFPLQTAVSLVCRDQILADTLCTMLLPFIDSSNPTSITPEIIERLVKHLPAGTSVQNIAHFGQSTETVKFYKFDYGASRNMKMYGRPDPPAHNFSSSKAPSVIFHGRSDNVVDTVDIQWVVDQLPNLLEFIQVKNRLWNHFDMGYSKLWNQTIYSILKPYLIRYEHIH